MKILKSCIQLLFVSLFAEYRSGSRVPAGEVSAVRPAELRSGEHSNLICIYFRICNFNIRISLWKLYTAVATFPFRKSTGKLQQKWNQLNAKKSSALNAGGGGAAGWICIEAGGSL